MKGLISVCFVLVVFFKFFGLRDWWYFCSCKFINWFFIMSCVLIWLLIDVFFIEDVSFSVC